ncbi:hypothetical protein [Baaleninema simplex]|uniref:hypothetical protein n=1 Tax=Baaleninema simplex TaxID=2862350 RepID=UPI00034A31F1|nr:hypothetical protein [Baaleninema simplex]
MNFSASFAAPRKLFVAFLLAMMLVVGGCRNPQTPAPPSETSQQVQPAEGGAVASDAVPGSAFNKFFPAGGDGYERVYTQEKTGFAEAKLKRDGQDIAMLAISDTISTPIAAQKFQNSQATIAGYPAVTVGNTQTAILVADRFQVKVISRSPDFTEADREAWIQRFDLSGLAQLK